MSISSRNNLPLDHGLDQFILSGFNDDATQSESNAGDREIIQKIAKISLQDPVSTTQENFDIFEYLMRRFSQDQVLLHTALTVASTPATSASVERAFSSFKIMLSHLRFNLSANSLNHIMICKLNASLLDSVDFEGM